MRDNPMGDVSLNQPLINDEPLPGSIAKGDQVLRLMSAGWTNERHSSFISSMEASFVDQLYGHENQGLGTNRCHLGGHGFKVIQEGVCKNLSFERNDARPQDGGIRCLPENPWIRRFRPRNVGMNRRGDGVEASVDDDGSGTDTVREKVRSHGREVKACAEDNLIGKSKEVSDQNFLDEEAGASNEPCKKRRPTCTDAARNDHGTL